MTIVIITVLMSSVYLFFFFWACHVAWGILIPWSGNLGPRQWEHETLCIALRLSLSATLFSLALCSVKSHPFALPTLLSVCSTPKVHLALSGFPLHSQVGIVGVYLVQSSWSFAAWCALFWWLLFHIYCLVFFCFFFSGKGVNLAPVTPKQSFWLIL